MLRENRIVFLHKTEKCEEGVTPYAEQILGVFVGKVQVITMFYGSKVVHVGFVQGFMGRKILQRAIVKIHDPISDPC